MHDFPLFPPDLVALPHELIPLHIFEERFKTMMNECLRTECEFGIVWRADRLAQQAAPDQPDADPRRHSAAGKRTEQTELHADIRPKAPREYSTSVIANVADFCLRPRGGLPAPQERRSGGADTLSIAEKQ